MAEETSYSGWEFKGVTEEGQGKEWGGSKAEVGGDCTLTLSPFYLCSSPELSHGYSNS